MRKNVEIISVNYNTPDLIDRLITSTLAVEGQYPIRIIDGSDKQPYKQQIVDVCGKYDNVVLQPQGWNIHHGRGMDLAVSTSNYKWVLIMDSDNYFQQPVIDKMLDACLTQEKFMCGWVCNVNSGGIDVPFSQPAIKYYHPSMLLINTQYYRELKSNGIGFIHHGAPCIQIMKYLHDKGISNAVGINIAEVLGINAFDNVVRGTWTNLASRGTINRFGIQL